MEAAEDSLFAGIPCRLLRRIGQGGMGEVWLANDPTRNTEVVVKLLRPELAASHKLIERLRREAEALGTLDHPNIVRLLDFGQTEEGRPYLVLERLRGVTLREKLRGHRYSPLSRSLADIQEVLCGLGAAHTLGLVHRDVKPSNVFVHHAPEGRRIKVLDFGIVKARVDRSLPKLTESGALMGTPRYMSPEQATGMPVDARTDLYAVGLVAYELIAGRSPWKHIRHDGQALVAQIREEPEPPSSFAPAPIPRELDALVMKALEKDPGKRFQSTEEFAHAISSVQQVIGCPSDTRATAKLAAAEPTDKLLSVSPQSLNAVTLSTGAPESERTAPLEETLVSEPSTQELPTPIDSQRLLEPLEPTATTQGLRKAPPLYRVALLILFLAGFGIGMGLVMRLMG